jgi:nitroimidazol reductase NimA-like FMN-containing flavoprotein (pyridoxamine 5'-phosphate oxidase superfamily)
MRRNKRVMSQKESKKLLKKASVGRLGVSWKNQPYVVPLNFVYSKGRIFFHCAEEGKKLDFARRNPNVCFEVDRFLGVKKSVKPCSYSVYYQSVIICGKANVVRSLARKTQILREIFEIYARKTAGKFDRGQVAKVKVVEIRVREISGKQNLPTRMQE